MIIFDIGANKGLFTDKCLSINKINKLIAIEPNPRLYEYLKNKYKNNETVIVLNNLVSEKNDELIDFYISNADTISTASIDWINKSRFANDYIWYPPIKIKSITLDELIKRYGTPDLIKVDVEGYELEVIKGLTIKQNEICFEWAEEEKGKINKTVEHLQSLGYNKFGFIYSDDYMVRPEKYTTWEDSEIHNDMDVNRKEKWGMIWAK